MGRNKSTIKLKRKIIKNQGIRGRDCREAIRANTSFLVVVSLRVFQFPLNRISRLESPVSFFLHWPQTNLLVGLNRLNREGGEETNLQKDPPLNSQWKLHVGIACGK